MLCADHVAYFSGHFGKVHLWPWYKLIILAGPFAVRRSHQMFLSVAVSSHLICMHLA